MSRSNIKKYHFTIQKFHDGLQGVKGQIFLGAFQNIVEVGIAAKFSPLKVGIAAELRSFEVGITSAEIGPVEIGIVAAELCSFEVGIAAAELRPPKVGTIAELCPLEAGDATVEIGSIEIGIAAEIGPVEMDRFKKYCIYELDLPQSCFAQIQLSLDYHVGILDRPTLHDLTQDIVGLDRTRI